MDPKVTVWKPVIIESRFKACATSTEEVHRAYLERCIRHCVLRGETPYASHKMLTDAFNDNDLKERMLGIYAGLGMGDGLISIGAVPIFYRDYGMGDGMILARDKYVSTNVSYLERSIGKNP